MTSKQDLALQYAINHYLKMYPAGKTPDEVLAAVVLDVGIFPRDEFCVNDGKTLARLITQLAEQFVQFAGVTESDYVMQLKNRIFDLEAELTKLQGEL